MEHGTPQSSSESSALGGGAGNPGGSSYRSYTSAGVNGTGGLLVLRADSYEGSGLLTSCGSDGGYANYTGNAVRNASGRTVLEEAQLMYF